MKKSLVLAMALAMGVTASAYAANPFSDVPAGHWAYDSIDKLAAAGVIDGMGDGTFQGDKTMTRYEMAQIVAKAMAKGANVDKLAAEFADELDALGVRVANLEKKADNVTITGQIRYEYSNAKNDSKSPKKSTKVNRLRTRLFVNGQINEDWAYHARLQNDENLTNNANDTETKLNQAWVEGKLGGLKVSAGKQPMLLMNGNLYDDTMTVGKVSYGKNVKLTAYAGQVDEANGYTSDSFWGAQVDAKLGVVGLQVEFDRANSLSPVADKHAQDDVTVWGATVKAPIVKGLNLDATYMSSNASDAVAGADDDGFVVGLSYLGANAKKPGTWGVWAKYYDQGVGTIWAHTMKTNVIGDMRTDGFKGYGVGVSYTFAKNITGYVDYLDGEAKEKDYDVHQLWTRLQFAF